jgi:peptidoglycan hydrolase-like protein with peptidoglycan-binding domain
MVGKSKDRLQNLRDCEGFFESKLNLLTPTVCTHARAIRMHNGHDGLQQVLSNGASGQWNTSPGAIDGDFGPNTRASVQAFQTWGGVAAEGVVADHTWAVSLHAASSTLETAVGLQYAT